MSEIIVRNAEVLQVHTKYGKDRSKPPYINAYIFQRGDENKKPQFFEARIKTDDIKQCDENVKTLEALVGKGSCDLILDEFRWDGKVNHSFLSTLKALIQEPAEKKAV